MKFRLKQLLLIGVFAVAVTAEAQDASVADTTVLHYVQTDESQMLRPLSSTWLDDVVQTRVWRDNWFVNLSGGASAFLGNPLGCEDLFGRIRPQLGVSVGKWFTPSIGSRIAFQGLQFRDCQLQTKDYQSLHADFLWNVAAHFKHARDEPSFDIVPYVGCGIICNSTDDNHPFALSYGLMGRYRLTQRLHLTLELGGTTTFRDFDGLGDSRKMGDNLLSLSAGLSVTIGKSGFRRVVDARPYIRQNDYLMAHSLTLAERNRSLMARVNHDAAVMAELKKILEIEGLLEANKGLFEQADTAASATPSSLYPRNDYSGLNSLRARLSRGYGNHNTNQADSVGGIFGLADSIILPFDYSSMSEDVSDTESNGKCIGSPVFIFFKLNTTEMTEPSQLVNIDAIARIVKKYGLRVRVTGAADSATGDTAGNATLAEHRASTIAQLLTQRGVPTERIIRRSVGGIDHFSPVQANRSTCIEILP